ncbi:SUZ domain-containing protein 1-like isoform X1 [Oncorhynchus keta]|uniref:SUZ domain-containing protein 1-like isoform X1 n=1 Tax=Oncorhynchus keta TaxID=8018 RepID=UPI0015FD6504|nr:SUZ domain-containing protein 1-like isoform X1 [Oncorhynchus keta]
MEDEEVCESWEEAADSGEIVKRLEAKLKISQKAKKASISSGSSPIRTAMVIQDESLPAAPSPQIRILKRPSSNGSLESSGSSNRLTQQPKSLAQREAEYAEARRRILGSASSEETPQDKPRPERPVRVSAQPPQPELVSLNNHMIRQPTGPDGTSGFRRYR